jgi:hypothetical protein
MSVYDQFKAKYPIGTKLDADGNGVWCVDTPKYYNDLITSEGLDSLRGNGKDWTNPRGDINWRDYYDFVPAGQGKRGDIVSWGAPQGLVNGIYYGHVGILDADDNGGPLSTLSQQQNGKVGLSICNVSRAGLLGFLRPKIMTPAKPAPTPQPQPQPAPQPIPQNPQVDLLDLVRRTIRGDFGNGQQRKGSLGEYYSEVQRQVNLNMQHGTTRWDNVRIY